jgi:pimeloyl-ACP methyl ester carboxylesterase
VSQGKDHVRRWIAGFPAHFLPRQLSIEKFLEDGEDVLALGSFRHTARATGRTFGGSCAIRFTFRGDLIARYQIFEDSLLVARAFDPADDVEANQLLRVNGTTYALSDRGGHGREPEVVVFFLHDLFQDREIFSPQVAALVERGHRCIAIDVPGHGMSAHPSAGWTLDSLTADISVLIGELVASPVAFVGLGLGGMVGLRLAARRPDLVSRLAVLAIDAALINRDDIVHLLGDVRAMTLVLYGEEDEVTPPDRAREIAEGVPRARLVAVPRAAHHPTLEAPEMTTKALIDLLEAQI